MKPSFGFLFFAQCKLIHGKQTLIAENIQLICYTLSNECRLAAYYN